MGELKRWFERDETKIFTVVFPVMFKVLDQVLLKRNTEDLWSFLYYKILGLIFCYSVLQIGLSKCWLRLIKC